MSCSTQPKCTTPKSVNKNTGRSQLLERLLQSPVDYVHDDRFEAPNAVHEILESASDGIEVCEDSQSVIQGQEFLIAKTDILSHDDEQTLFLAMNCRLFLAEKRRRQALSRTPTEADVRFVRRMVEEAALYRQKIATANQRLVISIAAKSSKDRSALADLIGEGNLILMKAINLFNAGRGFRFSTYGTYAISRHLGRIQKRDWVRKNRWSDDHREPIIEEQPSEWIDRHPAELVTKIMTDLPPREKKILSMRFGLGENEKGHTYEEIAQEFGISKERVRQIIVRACSQAKVRYAKAYGFED